MTQRHMGALLSPAGRQDGERQAPALALAGGLPSTFTFRHALPEVWDQGAEGSCTGHAVAGLAAFHFPGWMPSRRDPYWQGRNLIGMVGAADGAHLAAVLKAGQRWGYLGDAEAPYQAGDRAWGPPPNADQERKARHWGTYWRLGVTLQGLQQALWAGGPVAVVVEVDAAFNEAQGGEVATPKGPSLGLHAVLVVGYDAQRETFTIRNSWGASWGQGGHAEVSWLWLAVRLKEAWQATRGNGEPSPRPLWEMIWPGLFLEASNPGPSLA